MVKEVQTTSGTPDASVETRGRALDPFARFGLGDWFDRWPDMFTGRWPEMWGTMGDRAGTIRLESFDDEGTLVIRGEIPGVDPEADIDITVDNDVLTIAASRTQREEHEDEAGFRSEFHYGALRRSVSLPTGVTPDDITATYDNGILEVRVPMGDQPVVSTRVPITKG